MFAVIAAFFIGGTIGVLLMAIVSVASDADDAAEESMIVYVDTGKLYEIAERVRKCGSLDNAVSYLRDALYDPSDPEPEDPWDDDVNGPLAPNKAGAALLETNEQTLARLYAAEGKTNPMSLGAVERHKAKNESYRQLYGGLGGTEQSGGDL